MAEFNIPNRTVFCGDNLEFLRGINSNSVGCVYIDPPFNKKIKFHSPADSENARRLQFEDVWLKPTDKEAIHQQIRDLSSIEGEDEELSVWLDGVKAIDQDEGEQNYNYLVYMAVRLLECRRILKPSGSLFVHCDDTMSHFLKITLDCIFDEPNFRNEVVWQRKRHPSRNKKEARINSRMTDKIFWYTKTEDYKFQSTFIMPKDLEKEFPFVCEKTGRRYKDDTKNLYRGPGLGPCPSLCFDFHGFKPPNPSGWRTTYEGMTKWLEEGILVIEEVGGGLEN